MNKKKKNQKKRLSALILLLLLTVVMLTTSTYAWFTANKTVTIQGINVNVATSSGLIISTDAQNWKTSITNTDITTPTAWATNTNQFPANLVPVSTAGIADTTTGHLNMFDGTVGSNGTDFTLTSTASAAEAKGTSGNFIAFDIFLKTESAGTIYLTTSSNVIAKDGTEDKGLKNASRIAFVTEGNGASDLGATTYQGYKAGSAVAIWEPNSDVHTTNGVTAANDTYGITTTVGPGAAAIAYSGIKAAFAAGIKLNEANSTTNGTYFQDVTTVKTIATPTAYTSILTLATGVTKYRVYLWVEGQDVDCENNASGSDITFNIQLSSNSAPTTP